METLTTYLNYLLTHRRLAHVLYWIAAFVFMALYGLGYGQPLTVSFFVIMVDFPVQILATYLFLYVQLPWLFEKSYVLFTLSVFAFGYLLYLAVHFNYDFGIGTYLISWHKPHTVAEILTSGEFLFRNIVDIYIVVFITAIIKYVKDYWASKSRIEQLETEVAQVQYNSVVGQIQPQLILDSLDVIIEKSGNKSPDAPQVIAHLSDVLDGVLYKTTTTHHTITAEITQLESYLQLLAQVYPAVQQEPLETAVAPSISKIRVLSLQKVVSYIHNEVRKQLPSITTKWQTLIIQEEYEQKDSLILQITISHPKDQRLTFDQLSEVINTHFDEETKYDILDETEETIIKVITRL